MNNRIKSIRKELKLSQEEFGNRIDFTRSNVASVEIGRIGISDRFFNNVCREFDVNPEWLRTGEGSVYIHNPQQELMDNLMKIFLNSNDDIKELISIIPRLENKDVAALKQIAVSLRKK